MHLDRITFDTEQAKEYGVIEACIINCFQYWIATNANNGNNYHDGRYWTFNTNRAISEALHFANERQVRHAIDKLIERGVLVKGNYNKKPFDRTLWFAFTDEYIERHPNLAFDKNVTSDLTNLSNGNDKNVKPIPIDNTIYNHKEEEKKNTSSKEENFDSVFKSHLDFLESIGNRVRTKTLKTQLHDELLKCSNGNTQSAIKVVEDARNRYMLGEKNVRFRHIDEIPKSRENESVFVGKYKLE